MAIDSDIVLKLFDTLKETDKELAARVEKQTGAIVSMGLSVRSIETSVNQHMEDAKEVNECTEQTETTVKKIWDKVKKMYKSINIMILVVVIVFSLMVISYFFVRSGVEAIVDKKIKDTQQLPNHDKIVNQIEELKKHIEKLHPPVKP